MRKENVRTLNPPRILIAAAKSGSGKTTLTCALLEALKSRGLSVRAFKCGPDYIDPMFHRAVLGVESHNLDVPPESDRCAIKESGHFFLG